MNSHIENGMASHDSSIEQTSKRRLLLVVLILSMFLIFTFGVVLSTLLVDVAASFKISIGTVSQLSTLGRFVGLVTGFALSFLVIRFKLKILFVSGVAFFAIGILGAFFAPNFLSMLIFEAVMSMGSGIVGVLTITLIGEFFPLKERGWAIGLTTAAAFVAYIILPPISSGFADIGSWRSSLLWFIFTI
jgi:predicted MFS family arabinose efflux permease